MIAIANQAEALANAGRIADAFHLLNGAEAARDPQALLVLANWRLTGVLIRRDLEEARKLFGRAADLGHDDAERTYIAMLANGAGAGREWSEALQCLERRAKRHADARSELDLVGAMDLGPNGEPKNLAPLQRICQSPEIGIISGFLTPAECRYLIEAALPILQPSVVVDPMTGRFIRDPIRTSDAAGFPFVAETPAIHAINRRIALATATSPEQGEPLQVLRYRPGQEYKAHSDALPATDNQRVLTLLVYLNDAYEGGETDFLTPGISFRGKVGDAILFRNADPAGRPDPQARHAGRPVTHGEKIIASKWIRAKPLDLKGPSGRPF